VYLKEARYKKQRNRVGDHSWMSMVDILPSYETIPGDSLEVESSSRRGGIFLLSLCFYHTEVKVRS
jgi:hypothetical protein